MSDFADVLIPNPPYVLLVESYPKQISIDPDYNLSAYWLLIKLQTLIQIKFLTTSHIC